MEHSTHFGLLGPRPAGVGGWSVEGECPNPSLPTHLSGNEKEVKDIAHEQETNSA